MEDTIARTELAELRNMINGQSSGPESFNDKVEIAKGLGVFGHAAPTTQPLAIVNASGGATVDAEARTAINAVLAVLRANGLIAT